MAHQNTTPRSPARRDVDSAGSKGWMIVHASSGRTYRAIVQCVVETGSYYTQDIKGHSLRLVPYRLTLLARELMKPVTNYWHYSHSLISE